MAAKVFATAFSLVKATFTRHLALLEPFWVPVRRQRWYCGSMLTKRLRSGRDSLILFQLRNCKSSTTPPLPSTNTPRHFLLDHTHEQNPQTQSSPSVSCSAILQTRSTIPRSPGDNVALLLSSHFPLRRDSLKRPDMANQHRWHLG